MNQENYNTESRKGKHFCLWERKEIEKALHRGAKIRSIARVLGRSASSVSREIKRGTVSQRKKQYYIPTKKEHREQWKGHKEIRQYLSEAGQAAAKRNTARRGGKYKLYSDPELMRYIENEILIKRYSPDSILGGLKESGRRFSVTVCTKTIYNYIDRGLMKVKNIDLILKPRLKVKKRIVRQQKRILGESIEMRSKEANERQEFGHWEGDSIVGKEGKTAALTFVERITNMGFIIAVKDRGASAALDAIKNLRTTVGANIFKSITFDNGSEFARCHELESSGTNIYFAHPYSAWERGSNENYNGIVRRYIPKGKDLSHFKQADLNRINNPINALPRKHLGYKTAETKFNSELEKFFSYPMG